MRGDICVVLFAIQKYYTAARVFVALPLSVARSRNQISTTGTRWHASMGRLRDHTSF